jgi:putative transposase
MTDVMKTDAVAEPQRPEIDPELVERLIAGAGEGVEILGPDGLLTSLTKAVMEAALKGELTHELGYAEGDPAGAGSGNSRNGSYPKTVLTEFGAVPLKIPRDRNGDFEPQLVPKGTRRLDGFNERVISLYARGMTVRDIQAHVREMYQVELSPDLISTITDAVLDELREWQNRPLDAVYPVIYLDAIVCKVRHEGAVRNKAAHIAIGVDVEGRKHVLGIWLETAEGAKFWLRVITELRNRGVEDVIFVCCDGLKGLPEAIEAVWPRASVQTCVVHLIRSSLRFCSYKDRKAVVAGLKPIYKAVNVDEAVTMLEAFEQVWGGRYPGIVKVWRDAWERFIPFLDYPPEIRTVVYTTNAIESLNYQLRKVTKTRGHFPNDEALLKLLYLAIRNLGRSDRFGDTSSASWNWRAALNQFEIFFPGRLRLA